jgi:RPA family protein
VKRIFVVLDTSVIAPMNGEVNKSTKLDIVKPQPRYAVLTSASRPDAQKSLKKIGKKAAITVVANAELPPS